jgi:hypothetical protein
MPNQETVDMSIDQQTALADEHLGEQAYGWTKEHPIAATLFMRRGRILLGRESHRLM